MFNHNYSSVSIGDEVRFRISPDIIGATPETQSKGAADNGRVVARAVSPAQPRKARLHATLNKNGLIELDVSRREFRSLPSEVFRQLRVESLCVAENRLHTIPSAISWLHKLRVLDAHANHIIALSDTLANCSHLQHLDLTDNRLSTFPPQPITSLLHLRVLRLGGNRLEAVPHEISNLRSLQQLDLHGNKLWYLPHNLRCLTSLRQLNLSNNIFDQLPICVCQLTRLEALDLHSNKLTTLPAEFNQLEVLTELNVSLNAFVSWPHVITNLRTLHSLDISHNQLKLVISSLASLPRLRTLLLQGNAIRALPSDLRSIEYLNIADNKLINFSVAHMKRLRHLNASKNRLEHLPLGVYNLNELHTLKLNTNKIEYVSQDIILLKRLRVLDLGNNRLTCLPSVIHELENLQTFNIKGNKIEANIPMLPPQYAPEQMTLLEPPVGYDHTDEPVVFDVNSNVHRASPSHHDNDDTMQQNHKLGGSTSANRKSRRKRIFPFSLRRKKNGTTGYAPHSRHIATQYTPKSSVKTRGRPPLNYQPHNGNILTSFNNAAPSGTYTNTVYRTTTNTVATTNHGHHERDPSVKTQRPSHSKQLMSMNNLLESTQTGGAPTLNPSTPWLPTNGNSLVSEVSYPMTNTFASLSATKASETVDGRDTMYGQHRRRQRDPTGSIRSTAVTINDSVGDQLSLGEEDFDHQPLTVTDQHLLSMCSEVEGLLHEELLRPIIAGNGIFRKSLNEMGTVKTLNSLVAAHKCRARLGSSRLGTEPSCPDTSDGRLHVNTDVFLRHPSKDMPASTRLKADVFTVTPGGGLFRSSSDHNVSIYFPINAVPCPVSITMQIEIVEQDTLEHAKQQNSLLSNLLSVGPIVHVALSQDFDFNEQVALTIPAPPVSDSGKLHIVTYHDDNMLTPCSATYKVNLGYITIQAWHFSGKGALMTRSQCKFKACSSAELLLKQLHLSQ